MVFSSGNFNIDDSGNGWVGRNYTITLRNENPYIRGEFSLKATEIGDGWLSRSLTSLALSFGWWQQVDLVRQGRRVTMVVSNAELAKKARRFGFTRDAVSRFVSGRFGARNFCREVSRRIDAIVGRVRALHESDLDLTIEQTHALAMELLASTESPHYSSHGSIGAQRVPFPFTAYFAGRDEFVVLTENSLGRGSIKSVYEAYCYRFEESGRLTKEVLADLRSPAFYREVLEAEDDAARSIGSRNIQPVADFRFMQPGWFGFAILGGEYHMIVPKMEYDGQAVLSGEISLSQEEKVLFAADIAKGLAQLHSHHKVHRDFKADNLGMFNEGRIIDLGCLVDEGSLGWVGNAENGAPEIWDDSSLARRLRAGEPRDVVEWDVSRFISQQREAHTSEDVWAFGIFLLDLFTDARRDYFQMEGTTVTHALQSRYGAPGQLSIEEAIDQLPDSIQPVAVAALRQAPEERATAAAVEAMLMDAVTTQVRVI